MTKDTVVEHRTYGWTGRNLHFPIREPSPYRYRAEASFSLSDVQAYDVNVMTPAAWFDGTWIHHCYRCDRCKTYFFGTEISHFSHGCDDKRLNDIATHRCGHDEDIGPCWSESERQHKKYVASRFLCPGCQISKMTKEDSNAKQ